MEIPIAAVRIGTTSLTLSAAFRVAGSCDLLATAETVNVCVDARTLRKTLLLPELRAALERGAFGVVTDHAGYLPRPSDLS